MGINGKPISVYQRAEFEKAYLENLLRRIKSMPEGTQFTADEVQKLLDEIREEQKLPHREDGWDFSAEKAQKLLISDDILSIRPFTEADRENYQEICCEWTPFLRKSFEVQELKDDHWKAPQEKTAFFCMIETLPEHTPIGYIALKNTSVYPWELAIELDRDYCHKGFGSRSIQLFLRKITEITWTTEYKAVIEVDNIPSQKCFEKLGAKLVGLRVSKLMEDDSFRANFENTNTELIDEHMISLAKRLNVEPKKLLSHFLDYRLYTTAE